MLGDNSTAASLRDAPPDVTAATIAQQRLRASAYRALRHVRCESSDGAFVLTGCVSSFYFKQLAQEIVRQANGAGQIINELEVADRGSAAANGQGTSHVRSTEQQGSTETNTDVRILVVDDHAAVCESLRFVFAAAGIKQMSEVTTCEMAVAAVRGGRFDLVLLDLSLDRENGLDALRAIKAINASPPVLIHSSHDSPRWLLRSFHLGAAGYVVKGRDKNDLIRAVRQAAIGANVWTAEQLAQIRQADAERQSSQLRRATAQA